MEQCVYCQRRVAREKEHVIPAQFFPRPRPSNLITVPSCGECNRRFGKDEEYLRSVLLLNQECSSDSCLKLQATYPIHKMAQKQKGLFKSIYSSVRARPNRTRSGLMLPGHLVGISVNRKRLARVVEKIVFGLHYAKYSRPLSLSSKIGYQWFTPNKDFSLGGLFQIQEPRWPGIFDWSLNNTYGNDNALFAFALWDTYVCVGYYGIQLPIQIQHPWSYAS
jgi:hypothetical protein